jgi:hypothetical protein
MTAKTFPAPRLAGRDTDDDFSRVNLRFRRQVVSRRSILAT